MRLSQSLFLTCLLLLTACEGLRQAPAPVELPPLLPVPDAPVEAEATLRLTPEQDRYQRMIADWLYEGLRALREDRLMTPAERSAYNYFSRVLSLEPDNVVARDGMEDIVLRYVQLADTASRQGQFDNAESFLRRAGRVISDHEQISAGQALLARERTRTHSVHLLDVGAVRARDAERLPELATLALTAREDGLFVLITAPDDAIGRWIYGQMQEALEEHRLRGDIEIGQQPSVRLVHPPGARNGGV